MKIFLASVFYLFFASVLSAQEADTTFYSVVKTGIIAGEQKVWHTGLNNHQYLFYFNDRGRGDSVNASVRTNTDGLIVSLHVTGVDYSKNPYAERFEITGDSVISTINGVRKSDKFNNNWYNSSAVPGFVELQVNWLVRQPNLKGYVSPSNSIYTEEPIEKDIFFNGKTASLKLYALYSDSIALPTYVWFTKDMHFFASLGLLSTIQKGYETWTDTLLVFQEQAGQKYYLKEMKEQASDLPRRLIIEHATIFQSATASVRKDMTLEIVEGKITAVYPSSKKKKVRADSVIDAKGKFLMPGLWDMHVHYEGDKSQGGWYLAGGVTHVRDVGHAKILLSYKDQIARNGLLGPDIHYIAGLIDKQGIFQAPGGKIVSSLSEAIEAIHAYKHLGYQQIKLYSSIDPAWVGPMCAEAHKLGMRIGGHVPAFMRAEQAVNSGYDELNHINFLFLNFLGDTLDTRTPVRFSAVANLAGTIDLQSKPVQAFIRLLKEKRTTVDATLNLFAERFTEFKGDTSHKMKPIVNWLPASMQTDLAIKSPYGTDDKKEIYRSSFDNLMKMMRLLYDNGVQLVAGTDGGRAIALHREMELYVQAGIPANEVLKIVTYHAAKTCGFLGKYGEIKTGLPADLILIDGNPLQNISDVRKVEWVIKNNKSYNPKQLLAVRGWQYYY